MHADDALGTAALALQYHKGGCTGACIPILAIELGKASFAQKRPCDKKTSALAHKKPGFASDRNRFPGAGGRSGEASFPDGSLLRQATIPAGVVGQRIFPAN